MSLAADSGGVLIACPSCGRRNRLRYEHLHRAIRCGQCQTMLPHAAAPVTVTDTASFDAMIARSPLPVLVDFWAPWCGPCRMMAPHLERAAQSLAGRVVVAKVDTEALPELGARYRIQSIPTLGLFRNGREANRVSGALPSDRIEAFATS